MDLYWRISHSSSDGLERISETPTGTSYIDFGESIDVRSGRDRVGNTALLLATRYGQIKVMKLLIEQYDADINSENYLGETPLSYAAEKGWSELVDFLLQFTPKISIKSYEGAIVAAVENGKENILKSLLENSGCDSKSKIKFVSEAIIAAAERGRITLLNELFFSGYEIDLSSKNTRGYMALLKAAQYDHQNVVELLLRRKDVEIDAFDADGDTALHMAARNGNTDMVKLLLEKDATKVNAKNTSGQTALSIALRGGYTDMIEELFETDDLEFDGKTFSVDNSAVAIHEYFSLTDIQIANNSPGRTLLSWTTENGRLEELIFLLAKESIGINALDGDGRTPLSRAAENGHKLATKVLLKYNADANTKDVDGQTPLSRAAANGHKKLVELLLQHNADPNSTDNDGRAPLWWAVKNGHVTSAEQLTPVDTGTLALLIHEEPQTAMEFLLRFKPRLDQRDHQGRTALHLAAEWDESDIARSIVLQGGEVNSKDNYNMTPLKIAMKKGHIKVIEELLKHNVCTEGITIKAWRDAYGKQKEDIFLFFEAPGGENYIDFPQVIPSLQELYQTSPDHKSHLYVANSSKWPKMVIQTLPEAILVMNNLQVAERIDADILDISISFQLSVNSDIDRQLSSIYDNNVSRIMWRAIRPMNSRSPWTSILYFSTLSHGWIPDDGTDLFYQLLTHIKAQWVKLCEIFEKTLSDKRLEQFTSKGKSSEITDSLAKDAQMLAKLRTVLSSLTSDAEEFMNRYCEHFNANNIPQALQQLIKDDLEIGIRKRLEDLDQTVRDLLQIEFAWMTIHETRVATKLGQNVMLLTYVSIFYLPLGFCAALWAIPNITDNNTRTPFIVTATMVSVVTLLVTFNMEKIATIFQQGYQYGRNYLTSRWREMIGKQYPGLP